MRDTPDKPDAAESPPPVKPILPLTTALTDPIWKARILDVKATGFTYRKCDRCGTPCGTQTALPDHHRGSNLCMRLTFATPDHDATDRYVCTPCCQVVLHGRHLGIFGEL
jgi:hypothetical protein